TVYGSTQASMTSQLVTDARMMTPHRRGHLRVVLRHSEQGSQYTNEQFKLLLADAGIACSMSKRGGCWDTQCKMLLERRVNAAMESFFSTLKTERMSRRIECRACPASWLLFEACSSKELRHACAIQPISVMPYVKQSLY